MMNNCSQCGKPREQLDLRCAYCGSLNSKIDDILAKQAEETEKKSFKGKMKTILHAENKKQALFSQIDEIEKSLSLKGVFTLFLIFCFIFFMTYILI